MFFLLRNWRLESRQNPQAESLRYIISVYALIGNLAVARKPGTDLACWQPAGQLRAEFVNWRFFFAKWRGNLFGGM